MNRLENGWNRFELEDAIAQCFQTSEDIKILHEKIINFGMENDEIADTILGIQKINDLRCDKAFYIMEYMIKNGQMR